MKKVRINKKENSVIVNFNKQFYKQEFIDKAIFDFKEICEIKLSKEGLVLKPKQELKIGLLGYEFYNYVLGLMKN